MQSSTLSVVSPRAQELIARKAKQLAGRHGFSRSDFDDISQELTLRLLTRVRRFDPTRASENAFLHRTIENLAASLVRRQRALKRKCTAVVSLSLETSDPECPTIACMLTEDALDRRLGRERTSSQSTLELHLDFDDLVDRLPDELRQLCRMLLEENGVADVARLTGKPRTTLQSRLRQVRLWLVEKGFDEIRDTSSSSRRATE
jgi:RNA polymerase sigma-70 factor (ECF subfamily)